MPAAPEPTLRKTGSSKNSRPHMS